MTSQSYQEPRKKNGFLGLFRSRSTSRQQQSEHILQPKPIGGEGQEAPATKLSSSKVSLPLQTTPPAKYSNSSRRHTPATALPPTSVPLPNPERKGGATNFAPFRLLSKRHRTMSGASAEAVDGTNAGGSTVLTSPANSTRSPTPKLPPPQRDPVQATQDWRNKEEADTRGRGTARRRRPGVTFEGYAEDHPQAEQYKLSYVARVRSR
ncbi:hypothetical protein OF83DRAFT_1056517 [Amylostereum chailletii]|nr:hypothetical protein OF83DRAFT_1056517 [Amylostereum chailletii]